MFLAGFVTCFGYVSGIRVLDVQRNSRGGYTSVHADVHGSISSSSKASIDESALARLSVQQNLVCTEVTRVSHKLRRSGLLGRMNC